jgi:hypothetical protein
MLVADGSTGESRMVLRENTYGSVVVVLSMSTALNSSGGVGDLLVGRGCILVKSDSNHVAEIGDEKGER